LALPRCATLVFSDYAKGVLSRPVVLRSDRCRARAEKTRDRRS
jgi:hypothetical protein